MMRVSTLEILHWNDIHGRWAVLARLSSRARGIRAVASHPVLLLDAPTLKGAASGSQR